MDQLVAYIVKSLVDNPDKVEVTTENESEKVVIIKVSVDESDLGKVIGKGGRIASSPVSGFFLSQSLSRFRLLILRPKTFVI